MNTVLIIFLVVVIIVAIFLVIQFYNPSYLIQSPKPLNTGTSGQLSISANLLDHPESVRYYYEGWFYINSNAPVFTANVLFNRGNNFVVTLTGSTLGVYVNASSKTVPTNGVFDTSGLTPLTTIPNFPFQKWCHLIINVDGITVDMYVDGKFVKNVKSAQPIGTSTTDPITYGNQYTNGSVVRFRRPDTVINPQGVWSNYMLGSGQSYTLTNYHLDAQLTKNKHVTNYQRLV